MKKILIVEDQQDVQTLLKVALSQPDRILLHAENAVTGLTLAREERPDLVLLDIMMPGSMDGMGLLRELKADSRTAAAKIIVLSAKAQQQDKDKAGKAGAYSYITKPFRLSHLKECIHNALL